MRYVIHVGPTKTGSKGLQTFLAANAAGLAQEGVYYPQGGPGRNALHHAFLRLHPLETIRQFARQVGNDASSLGAQTVVLSGETLSNISGRRWRLILQSLAGDGACDQALAVYYARNIAERLLSRAAQIRKGGRERLAGEDVADVVARTASPTAQLQALETGFGPGAVVVRSYDAAASLAADFLQVVGVEWSDAFAQPKRVNVSLDPIAGNLIAALEEEYELAGLHSAADKAGPAPSLPVARRRQLEQLLPIIEAVDVSHPLLAPHRAEMTEIRWPDPAQQTPFAEYVAYLRRVLDTAAEIHAARERRARLDR